MRTVVHGEVPVHYGQIYVHSAGGDPFEGDLSACFAGQRNGLCGAAVAGTLFLLTGLHTGEVGFTAEVHETEPPDAGGADVVEAPFHVAGPARLVTWGGEDWWDLELTPGDYRVRYSGTGMDAGDGPGPEHYLLQFWAAPPAPDAVIRHRSAAAAYWHDFARKLPAPDGVTSRTNRP
ncbi:hypothetical protein [Amycolatopsis sp. cg9]|uniref:hypothetical protein n=1 Tax=Amycolatopsis sp. cg9 TaxID=3238801 RepID=UPI003526829D